MVSIISQKKNQGVMNKRWFVQRNAFFSTLGREQYYSCLDSWRFSNFSKHWIVLQKHIVSGRCVDRLGRFCHTMLRNGMLECSFIGKYQCCRSCMIKEQEDRRGGGWSDPFGMFGDLFGFTRRFRFWLSRLRSQTGSPLIQVWMIIAILESHREIQSRTLWIKLSI